MTIHELDEATIRKIAAGEVVERPASIVKELVENSIDADASRIDVAVDRGGKHRVRVRDDGVGMSREEVRLAVKEHTTSKIRDIDDLESGVGTLGFRGEALHAIGAVSKVSITTRPRDAETATELRIEGGEVVDVGPAGRGPGTTVEITDLFYNTPAREKFLKTDATEFDRVNSIVTRYALANPDIAVSLSHDDREVFGTTGQGDLEAALLSVYGRDVATSMIELPDAGRVSGYVSHPETTRSTRDYISTYVNDRYVTSGLLREAIIDAYGKQLAANRYPFALLFLDLPPDEIDINVHPRKLEVRFENQTEIQEGVRSAVEDALLEHGLIRSSAPRGRSAPDEATIDPERSDVDAAGVEDSTTDDHDRRERADMTGERDGGSTAEPEIEERSASSPDGEAERSDDALHVDRPAEPTEDENDDKLGVRERVDIEDDIEAEHGTDHGTASNVVEDDREGTSTARESLGRHHVERAGPSDSDPERKFADTGVQTTLTEGRVDDEMGFERLPPLRVLGQLDDTYIIASSQQGLLLIDQHAADERINYERLCAEVAANPTSQALAEPVNVELTARENAAFQAYADALDEVGFRVERIDDRTVEVRAVPTVVAGALDPTLLRDVIAECISGETADPETSIESRADVLLADLACYPSITGNTSLTDGTTLDLLRELDACENPYACPHGRPVVIEFSTEEIEDRFERDYPGHSHRRRG